MPVRLAQEKVVGAGITINALAIQLITPTAETRFLDVVNLDEYFKQCVIGGDRAFVISVKTADDFKDAIFHKLIIEVSGNNLSAPSLLTNVSSDKSTSEQDCLIGEKMLRKFFQDRFKN